MQAVCVQNFTVKICVFRMMTVSSVADPVAILSCGQACDNGLVYQHKLVNSNFDKCLNHIHHMVPAVGRTVNKVYTFKNMLK